VHPSCHDEHRSAPLSDVRPATRSQEAPSGTQDLLGRCRTALYRLGGPLGALVLSGQGVQAPNLLARLEAYGIRT